MREDELRALARDAPSTFRAYVGFLKDERDRKLVTANKAEEVSYFTSLFSGTMVGITLASLLVASQTRHDVGAWKDGVYACLFAMAVFACMYLVAKGVRHIVYERIRRITGEIALANSILPADSVTDNSA